MADAMAIDPVPALASSEKNVTSVMGGNAPNLDGILLLEAPFARVPFDELRSF